jgi:sodium/pantothenate symporter
MLLGIVAFTFGYMMFGGANSMVYTNAAQAIIMLIVAIILLSSGFNYFSGSSAGLFSALNTIDPQLTSIFNPSSPLFRDFFEVIVCQLIVGIAIVCQPHIITRSLLLKSEKSVNKYLVTGVVVQTIFFLVVFTGLYARVHFPGLVDNGKPIPLDAVMSTWVVSKFPAIVSTLLVWGMMAAGISTLEGLIQSLSTTITEDIIKPVFSSKTEYDLTINRVVIFVLGVIAFLLSWEQLRHPDLSVGIFAQNGVYAFFSAAFVPVLFGIFLKKIPAYIPFTASVMAVIVHFGVYYFRLTPYMEQGTRNPGIASALAIVVSVVSAMVLYAYFLNTQKKEVLA